MSSLLVENREASVVGDHLQPTRPHGGIPPDALVAGLERIAGRGPRHEGDPLPVLREDEADRVARPVRLAHVVEVALKLAELPHLVELTLTYRYHLRHSLPRLPAAT